MNNLKVLRSEAGLTTRKMREYTGITNSVITYLESGKRAYRQTHIDTLSYFFDVTADYLLGRSDYGIRVYPQWGQDPVYLTGKEYDRLRDKITITIVNVGDTPTVYRELKGTLEDYNLTNSLGAQLNELVKRMDADELERTIRFIEDYILKK